MKTLPQKRDPKKRTVEHFQAELAAKDMTLMDWSRQHGFCSDTVYQVTCGRLMGVRGQARKVMRAMGLPVPERAKARKTDKQ